MFEELSWLRVTYHQQQEELMESTIDFLAPKLQPLSLECMNISPGEFSTAPFPLLGQLDLTSYIQQVEIVDSELLEDLTISILNAKRNPPVKLRVGNLPHLKETYISTY